MIEKASVPQSELEWALSYPGYERLASDPNSLYDHVLRPARSEFDQHASVPDWCGVDLLRGWLFYLQREDHHSGGWPPSLGVEWISVLYALQDHPNALASERPRTIFGHMPGRSSDAGGAYPPIVRGERRRELDIKWREHRVGRLLVNNESLEYHHSSVNGMGRFVRDFLRRSAMNTASPVEAALSLMQVVDSIPEVATRPWPRPGVRDPVWRVRSEP